MSSIVTIVDYGVGNLFSVCRGLVRCGAQPVLADSPRAILDAERLILPGVGSFANGMKGLRDRGQDSAIKEFVASGRPFLGICLGMQMMLEESEEFGTHKGLGLIPGRVVAVPDTGVDGRPHKIPHIGWNTIYSPSQMNGWDKTIFKSVDPLAWVYFVHSFAVVPSQKAHVLAETGYNGRVITAAVRSGNMYGCQFHPEKSGPVGLGILNEFCGL